MGKLDFFAEAMARLCSRCLAAPGAPLRWAIIANPTAGGFTVKSFWKRHEIALKSALSRAEENPSRDDAGVSDYAAATSASGLILTQAPGHASGIVSALLNEAAVTSALYLVITAGGDGTSLEALQTIFAAPPELRSRFVVLRLPMGTGNDGADAPELADALDLLIKPSILETARAVQLSTASGKTRPDGQAFLAFNILSAGLDAFVTHMTNKMKGHLPGDSYKLWVDIAALLYDKLYRIGGWNIRGYDEKGAEVQNISGKFLLCAMGVSGRRSYGAGKKIIPDERNVCALKQMPLLRKLQLKGLFSKGTHIRHPESVLWTAHKLIITAEDPVLAQMDGETVMLQKEDFPITMEVTQARIQKLGKR